MKKLESAYAVQQENGDLRRSAGAQMLFGTKEDAEREVFIGCKLVKVEVRILNDPADRLGPMIVTTWKRRREGGYRGSVELILPLKRGDIRRKTSEDREVRRFIFKGQELISKVRPKNRRIPFSRGEDIGLDVRKAHLELRWERREEDGFQWFCHYELILPVVGGGTLRAALGGTRVGTEKEPVWEGRVDTPFRDHAHAQWDGLALGLKAWAVYGSHRTEVESRKEAISQ